LAADVGAFLFDSDKQIGTFADVVFVEDEGVELGPVGVSQVKGG
jgi:hypothetical protein